MEPYTKKTSVVHRVFLIRFEWNRIKNFCPLARRFTLPLQQRDKNKNLRGRNMGTQKKSYGTNTKIGNMNRHKYFPIDKRKWRINTEK